MCHRMSSRFSEHTFQMMRAVTRDSTEISAMQSVHIMRNSLVSSLAEAQGTGFMPAMTSKRGTTMLHRWQCNTSMHDCTCTASHRHLTTAVNRSSTMTTAPCMNVLLQALLRTEAALRIGTHVQMDTLTPATVRLWQLLMLQPSRS